MIIEYLGKNKMFLHKEIGKGTMPDGRGCRCLMTNAGIHFQVYKDKEWDSYFSSWINISKEFADGIIKLEEKQCSTTTKQDVQNA